MQLLAMKSSHLFASELHSWYGTMRIVKKSITEPAASYMPETDLMQTDITAPGKIPSSTTMAPLAAAIKM